MRAILASETKVVPYYANNVKLGRFALDLARLEQARDPGGACPAKLLDAARASGKEARAVGRKVASARVEVHRHMARLHWLAGHQGKAQRLLGQALGQGEELGARPELAHTKLAISRWLEEHGGPTRLLDQDAAAYLEQGRSLLAELNINTTSTARAPRRRPAGRTGGACGSARGTG